MKSLSLILACFCFCVPIWAQISISNESPRIGDTITVKTESATDTLFVTYRPNSAIAVPEPIVLSESTTSFSWTPNRAGVVQLAAKQKGSKSTKNVSVRFSTMSYSGIFVMLFAGIILFGGATFAFRILFDDAEEDGTLDFDPENFPDT